MSKSSTYARGGLLVACLAALSQGALWASASSGGDEAGTLTITSTPPAKLFVRTGGINGYVAVGRTPVTLSVVPGLLEFTLMGADRQLVDRSVWIKAGDLREEQVTLPPGRVFIVDNGHPRADDANPGTAERPWETIRHATKTLTAGDTALVREGRYLESRQGWMPTQWATPILAPAHAGEPGRPITFRAYAGGDVFVTTERGGCLGGGGQFIRWRGFRSNRRVILWNAEHCAVTNCEIMGQYRPTKANHDGFRIQHSQNILVRNCLIHGVKGNSYNSAGIKCYDVRRLIVEHCDIYQCHCCVFDKDSGKYNLYRRCLLRAPQREPRPGGPNVVMHTHGGASIDGCEIYGSLIAGEGVYYNTWNVGAPLRFHNNTFYRAGVGSKGRRMLVMFNNIFLAGAPGQAGGRAGYRLIKSTERPASDHNLFFPNVEFAYAVYTPEKKTYRAPEAWQRDHGLEAHSQVAAPLLAAPEKGQFRLQPKSPAIDRGRPVTYAVGQGRGKELTVRWAWSFPDGLGLIAGDLIGVGTPPQPARVTEVLGESRLKLDRRVTWRQGDPVSFPYAGSAPDLGAWEHGDPRAIVGPTGWTSAQTGKDVQRRQETRQRP